MCNKKSSHSQCDGQDVFEEYHVEIKRTMGNMLVWGLMIVVLLYISGRFTLITGFILGLTASLVYYGLLCFRIQQSSRRAAEEVLAYMRGGWLIRLSFVVLVLIVALKLPGINFLSAVIGLFSFQIVMLFQTILFVLQQKK